MKKIAVVANNKDYAVHTAKSLEIFFSDYARFTCYSMAEIEQKQKIDENYVVLSTFNIFQQVKRKTSEETKILIIDVVLNKETLKKLYKLPSNAKALLVNIDYRNCMEVITMIYNCGFKQLELIPYYPGCSDLQVRDINIAITPGELTLVPKGISTVIDLGERLIDVNSIYKIGDALGVENPISSETARAAVEKLAAFNPEMDRLMGENSSLSGRIDTILKLVKQGIIITDMSGKIYLANEMAQKMLQPRSELLIGFGITEVLPEFIAPGDNLLDGEPAEKLITVEERKIITKVSCVEESGELKGMVVMLEYFEEAENRQHKMRRKIRGYGHKAFYTFDQILGDSKEIEETKKIAMRMAGSDSGICIFGESGTGKELFAQSIHNYSARKDYQFVAINCSALPENLLESELYGYEEGAFSGAKKGGKIGLFELAHQGTLFLDEVGELPMLMQAKLLRAIEEQKILRIGGQDLIDVDVRVICATNRDLRKMVEEGTFRQDLYYRICILPIYIPPLRQRGSDIFMLMEKLKEDIGADYRLDGQAERMLAEYDWPGNVRELKNITEYLANLGKPMISCEDIPLLFQEEKGHEPALKETDLNVKIPAESEAVRYILQQLDRAQREKKHIGRQTLAEQAEAEGIFLTEPEVRRILKELKEEGVIVSFRGRKGSALTEKGQNLLRQ